MRLRYRRRRARYVYDLQLNEALLSEAGEELHQIRQTWQVRWQDVQLGDLIGSGGFGDVHRATWLSTLVACKRVKQGYLQEESEAFAAEATVMSQLRHPHIVAFYGAGIDNLGRRFLLTELLSRGSLRTVLADNVKHPSLDWHLRLRFCRDIAAGMLFLHSRDPPMLHRDLKADNCLLDDRWGVKVADFGTMRTMRILPSADQDLLDAAGEVGVTVGGGTAPLSPAALMMTATGGCGSPLWVAPEVTANSRHGVSHYGMASDVYSFGLTVFEVATRQLPFADVSDVFRLRQMVEAGDRPTIPAHLEVPGGLLGLMQACWHADPEQRPTFAGVGSLLEGLEGELDHGQS